MIKRLLKILGPKTTVAGIITNNSKILLTKRSRLIIEGGKWCLPGGQIKFKETPEQAVKREIKEETGLTAKKTRFLFYFNEVLVKIDLHSVVLVFLVDVSGKIKTNWEVSEAKWLTKQEIKKLDIAFEHKKIIDKFLSKAF